MLLRAAAVWLGILVLANLNGALRELLLTPRLGPAWGHALSTFLVAGIVFIMARSTIGWIRPLTGFAAITVGALRVVLTLSFEFGAVHVLFGRSWAVPLARYDLAAGRIWLLVPLITLFAPFWAWRPGGPPALRSGC